MMTYFEVRDRLNTLVRFRALYIEYIDFTNRPNNLPAQLVRRKMEPLSRLTVESLGKVGLGAMVTRDAPVRGGRKIRINLIKAIFRDQIIKRFSLDDKDPLNLLDKAILRYRRLLWQQKLQLVNPLFWLFVVGNYAARLPLLIFHEAGYDTSRAEKQGAVKLYLAVFQICFFYFVAEVTGLISWLRFDVIALLPFHF